MEDAAVTVMIVDDQAPFRMAARMVVQLTDGFDVVAEAETGEASIDMAAQLHPDLVLMDFNLPGIDGMEATRRIRASSANPPVVVMLSTYEADEYGPRAVEAGAAAFIPKSDFDPDRLLAAWHEAVGAAP